MASNRFVCIAVTAVCMAPGATDPNTPPIVCNTPCTNASTEAILSSKTAFVIPPSSQNKSEKTALNPRPQNVTTAIHVCHTFHHNLSTKKPSSAAILLKNLSKNNKPQISPGPKYFHQKNSTSPSSSASPPLPASAHSSPQSHPHAPSSDAQPQPCPQSKANPRT